MQILPQTQTGWSHRSSQYENNSSVYPGVRGLYLPNKCTDNTASSSGPFGCEFFMHFFHVFEFD